MVWCFIHVALAGFIGLSGIIGIGQASAETGRPVPPMNHTIEQRFVPDLDHLFHKIIAEKRGLKIDGVSAFNGKDKFLPGKIAIGLTQLIVHTADGSPVITEYLDGFRQIADMTIDDPNDTWGMYYYALALYKLQKAGLLEKAVSQDTLAKLRLKLDWRRFVRTGDYTLIDLPNNYYGVAFGIARLRNLLGWDDGTGAEILLAKAVDHYRSYSGIYGFADETNGDGRFDRYSILLSAELAQRIVETGLEPSDEVKAWLRRSVDVMLQRMNQDGTGFEYGRSIGVYGETALLEVFAVAAEIGLLTPAEQEAAYAFSSRVAARYDAFWFDRETSSVNMWKHGRRTDTYRGIDRILGENLSLAHQYIYTNDIWNNLAFKNKTLDPNFNQYLASLPQNTATWFFKGQYDRLLITLRDHNRIIGLPLIGGGAKYHRETPYYPIPFSNGMLAGVADGQSPQLLARITLADGTNLMPLSFIEDVRLTKSGKKTIIDYHQNALDNVGDKDPKADSRIGVTSRYSFEPGKITRRDVYTAAQAVAIKNIAFEFASFSDGPHVSRPVAGQSVIRFDKGAIREFMISGIENCSLTAIGTNHDYETPNGPMQQLLSCKSGSTILNAPLAVEWAISYR